MKLNRRGPGDSAYRATGRGCAAYRALPNALRVRTTPSARFVTADRESELLRNAAISSRSDSGGAWQDPRLDSLFDGAPVDAAN
jgi:hypothetical protein